uniref:Transmembrane protein n=1 Tax=Neobodo designis TaxID=312471 RepID=A0A7S1MSL1_NEODS
MPRNVSFLATVVDVMRDPFGFKAKATASSTARIQGSPTRRFVYAVNLMLLFSFVGINITAMRPGPDGAPPAVDMWAPVQVHPWVTVATGIESITAGVMLYWGSLAFLLAPAFQGFFGLATLRSALPVTLLAFAAAVWLAWIAAFVWPSLALYAFANGSLNVAYSVADMVLDQCQVDDDEPDAEEMMGASSGSSPARHDGLSVFDESPHSDQSYRAAAGTVFLLMGVLLLASTAAPDVLSVRGAMLVQLSVVTLLAIAAAMAALPSRGCFVAPADADVKRTCPVGCALPLVGVSASLMLPDACGDAIASVLVRKYKSNALAVTRLIVSGCGWCLSHPRIHVVVARKLPRSPSTSALWPTVLLIVRAVLLGIFCQLTFGPSAVATPAWEGFALAVFAIQCLVDSIGGRMLQNVGDTQNRRALWDDAPASSEPNSKPSSSPRHWRVPTWLAHFAIEVFPNLAKRTVTVFSDGMVSTVLRFADTSAAASASVAIGYLVACGLSAATIVLTHNRHDSPRRIKTD